MARTSHRDLADGLVDIERRLDAIESQIARLKHSAPTRTSSSLWQTTDRVTDILVSALADVSNRFRGLRDNAEAAGSEAVRFGNDAVRRLSAEVVHRPLVLLAVAAGLGLL